MDNNILLNSKVNSPLQQLSDPLFKHHRLNVFIKRDDLIHPQISGNKWRKLKYNLIEAKRSDKKLLISFGGAYSNHIHALASACQLYKFETLGIIRGEFDPDNPTLKHAKAAGMTLKFISRIDYKKRHELEYLKSIEQQYPQSMIIPEGGSNAHAMKGVKELVSEIPSANADYIICPCGSGGTTAGLLSAITKNQTVVSIAVLKNAEYLIEDILKLSQTTDENLDFVTQYHQGGYGKITPQLLDFIKQFYQSHKIQLEPVYSGKMMYAFYDLVRNDYFKPGSSITLIHTGGLQGLNGMKQRGIITDDLFS